MDSSVSGKDEIWFLRVCHHVPHELYHCLLDSLCSCTENGSGLDNGLVRERSFLYNAKAITHGERTTSRIRGNIRGRESEDKGKHQHLIIKRQKRQICLWIYRHSATNEGTNVGKRRILSLLLLWHEPKMV